MRVKGGPATRARRKKWIKANDGAFGTRHVSYRVAKQSVIKNEKYAYRDRKAKKSDFRKLWILRINAALKGLSENYNYSKFISKMHKKNIKINRKMLSELAINEPEVFKNLVNKVMN